MIRRGNFRWEKEQRKASKLMEVTTGMREKEMNNMEWVDREKWRNFRHRKMCKDQVSVLDTLLC